MKNSCEISKICVAISR